MKILCPPLHIFLVENHVDTAGYLRMYLEQGGHRVTLADTVQSALREYAAAKPDVVLSDIGLPDGTGWDLLEGILAIGPVYAVAMSGFGSNFDRDRSYSAGFRAHLMKPFYPDELDQVISEAHAFLTAPTVPLA